MEHVDEVEKLLVRKTTDEREDDLEKLIAISHVKRACLRACGSMHRQAAEEGVTRAKLEEMREGIERDIQIFGELLNGEAKPRHRRHVATAVA